MTFVAAAIAGSALVGAYASSRASSTQARAQRQAGQIATDTYNKQAALQAPYQATGVAANNALASGLGVSGDPTAAGYGSLAAPFTAADFTTDPGYGFELAQGQQALERSAAARGGLLSGATLKGTESYAQGLASQEYQNAFNRYQTQQQSRIGALQNLSNSGQQSVNSLTNAASNYGANLSGAATGAGEASAAGDVGVANALDAGISNYQSYTAAQPLNNLLAQYYAKQTNASTYAPAASSYTPASPSGF